MNKKTMLLTLFTLFILLIGISTGITYSGFQSTAQSSGTLDFSTPIYDITLDNANATTNGTGTIYEKYVIGVFQNSTCTTEITTNQNNITVPARAYTISFNSNDGSACADQTSTYTFNGYYTLASGGVQLLNASGYITNNFTPTYFDSNSTLHAQWTSASITLPTPTRTGYTFAGWYNESGLTNKAGDGGDSYTPTNSKTLYAKWTANAYVITMYMNGGSALGSAVATYNSSILTNITHVSRVGYTLTGYWTAPTGGTKVINANGTLVANVSGYTGAGGIWTRTYNAELNAQWSIKTFTIAFDSNGGSACSSITANYGASITLPTPTKTDYIFLGWFSDESNNQGVGSKREWTTMPDLGTSGITITVYAAWKPRITINSNGHSLNVRFLVYTNPQFPSQTNMIINSTDSHWYTTSGRNYIYSNSGLIGLSRIIGITSNTTGYTFEYLYCIIGGNNVPIVGTDGVLLPNVNGFTDSSGEWIGSGGAVFYAQWTADRYAVTLDKNGGSGSNQTVYMQYDSATIYNGSTGSTTASITNPTKTGYTFGGWTTAQNSGSVVVNTSKSLITNISDYTNSSGQWIRTTTPTTLYAKWTANTYNITYNTNGGNSISAGSYTFSTSAQTKTLTTPSRTGYTFAGYTITTNTSGSNSSITSNTTLNIPASAYGNITVQASWTANQYSIIYKDGGDTNFSGTHESGYPTTHTYGTATTLKSASKTGYTFGGWFTTSACTGSAITSLGATAYTNNITLYAKWTVNTYTISYTLNSGTAGASAPTSGTYDVGLTISNPTRTGYTFNGWNISGMDNCTHYYGTSSSSYSTSTATSLSNITSTWFKNLRSTSSTVTFNAQWVLATYTITLYSSPSTTAGTTTIYEKYSTGYYTDSSCTNQMTTTTNQITVPTRTGYTFVGYYTGEHGAGTQYINQDGYITGRQSNTQFSTNNGTLVAYWIDNDEGGYFQTVRILNDSDSSIIMKETLYFENTSLTISFTSRFGMRIAAISDGVKSYTYSPLNDLSDNLVVVARGNIYNIQANIAGSDISFTYSSWYNIDFRT